MLPTLVLNSQSKSASGSQNAWIIGINQVGIFVLETGWLCCFVSSIQPPAILL